LHKHQRQSAGAVGRRPERSLAIFDPEDYLIVGVGTQERPVCEKALFEVRIDKEVHLA